MRRSATRASRENPGVIAPPPLIALAAILLGAAIDWLVALGLLATVPFPWRVAAAVIVGIAGLNLGVSGMLAFRRIGTHIEPWKPATALATEGVYAHLRNPMYLGLALGILALALGFASDGMLLMLVLFALVIHFGVVLREEPYLEAKFGKAYRRYRARVPRYGWKF